MTVSYYTAQSDVKWDVQQSRSLAISLISFLKLHKGFVLLALLIVLDLLEFII